MTCSNCNENMVVGKSKISATFWGFFLVGLSYKNLIFNDFTKDRITLKNHETKKAYYCNGCGSVFILNQLLK